MDQMIVSTAEIDIIIEMASTMTVTTTIIMGAIAIAIGVTKTLRDIIGQTVKKVGRPMETTTTGEWNMVITLNGNQIALYSNILDQCPSAETAYEYGSLRSCN